MTGGWSVNLTSGTEHFFDQWPVPPLWEATVEVVFYSVVVGAWVHIVSEPFRRDLPADRVQCTPGDLIWVGIVKSRAGVEGLLDCVAELQTEMVPSDLG